mgnify:FL=1
MADGKKNGGAMDEAKNVAKKKAKKKIVGAILGAVSQLIIPILIIVVLIASVMLIAQQITNMINGIKDGWSSFWNRDGIVVSDEFVDEFIKNLKAQGIGVGSMGMTESNAKDYIKSFIEASLVTQTVNTHNNGIAVAGGIELKRHDSRDNQLHDMSYTEAFDEGADFNKVRYTYSLDESGNIVYPVSNGSGGYTTRTIDKSAYEQHAIPVMFFIDLCTATQSPNYVKALSDHIKNEGQTMTITLLDSYYVSYKEVHHEYIASGATNHTWDTQEDSTTTISTMPYVTEVNHLLYKMSQTYTRSEPSVERTEPETVETKGKGAEANVTLKTTTTTVTENYRFSSPIEQDPVIKCEEDDFFVKESKKKYYTSYKQNAAAINTYKKDGTLLFTMMDMNLDNDRLEQILKYVIYKMTGVDYGVTSLDGSLFKLNSINSLGAGGIAEVIKSFENGDLRYYMKGDSDDYSNWYVNNFVTQDRKQYKLAYSDYDKTWNFSYGIMVYDEKYDEYNNVGVFNQEGVDIRNLVNRARNGEQILLDVEIVDRVYNNIVKNKQKILSDLATKRNAELTNYQIDALTNVHYQYGNAGDAYISNSKNIMELYKQYYAKGKTEEFKNIAICEVNDGVSRNFFIRGEPAKRGTYEWIMFDEGIYTLADGTIVSGASGIIEVADKCHKYMEEKLYTYRLVDLPATANDAWNVPYTCCATYVDWVLAEAGYKDKTAGLTHSAPSLFQEYAEKGFTLIGTYDELQAGDLAFFHYASDDGTRYFNGKAYTIGHVQIYAGDGKWYNAGCTEAIQAIEERYRPSPYGDDGRAWFVVGLRPN